MKKLAFLLLFATTTFTLNAQSTRFVYEVTMKTNAADPSVVQTELAYLDVNGTRSVYYSENSLKRDSVMQRMRETRNFNPGQMAEMRSNMDYRIEKNLIEQQTVYHGRIGRDQYQYVEDRQLNWKILPETVSIGAYKTQKAEADFAGRKWTAWFTPDIPFQEGPYKFYGLPGLIVKVEDADGDYEFNLKQVKKIENPANFVSRGTTVKLKRADFEKQNQKFRADPASFMTRSGSGRAGSGGGNRGAVQSNPNRIKEMQNRLNETLERTSNPIER